MKQRVWIRALLVLLVTSHVVAGQQPSLQRLDEEITRAMREWEVPGLAIAIVKDDALVYAKGYGVRTLGRPEPVTEHTIFAIGSASKAFTAAALGMLVDDGKISWDDPVTTHLKGFQLFDPYVTRELTVRDLLCHRSGLDRAEMLWYGSDYSRDEILRRVRFLKPSWSFRSRFGYQNIMYLAAGQIIPAVTGKSWDEFIREGIFAPLGMTESTTSITELKKFTDVATPHAKIDDVVRAVPWRNIDNIAPAGSINSTVLDMAQWVRLHLNEGRVGKERLLSSGVVKEMQKSHTIIPYEPPFSLGTPEAHFLDYGLGWFLHDYRGRKIVQHGGNIDGMSALVALAPEERLGLVILTNLNGTFLPYALMYRIFDLYFGGGEKDWSAELLKTFKAFMAEQREAEKKIEENRVSGTKPSLALEQYAGTYTNEMYGEMKVAAEAGKLTLRFGSNRVADLEHWHYDTFQARWRDPLFGKTLVTFRLDPRGKAEEVMAALPGMSDAVFKRTAEKAGAVPAIALSETDLQRFVGRYVLDAPPLEISVELVGGRLKAVVPGQPVYTLVPVAPTRFQIQGAPAGFFIQFDLAEGKVKSLTLEQGPGPKFTFRPKN